MDEPSRREPLTGRANGQATIAPRISLRGGSREAPRIRHFPQYHRTLPTATKERSLDAGSFFASVVKALWNAVRGDRSGVGFLTTQPADGRDKQARIKRSRSQAFFVGGDGVNEIANGLRTH